ncbi:Uncharacterised protein [Sphingobacterium multivorum]|uniref:RteC domain-containing protein n=1 Tax=Sphingobacterium multivorum TaxID=28454 RepID=UPI000E0669FB|nr:RteC domain-containing protein [Sphingobacterium multivorum]SUJ89300.1 Uncharacterised protein [Sphingobacterium multivorum]
MKYPLNKIIDKIHHQEEKFLSNSSCLIDAAKQMTFYLQGLLSAVKKYVLNEDLKNDEEEVQFFRTIKPQILGRLIYYNKVYRIDTTYAVTNGKMY